MKQFVSLCLLAILIGHSFPCQAGTSFSTLSKANSTEAPSRASTFLNVAELDGLIARIVQEKHLIGLSVGVVQNGQVVLAKGYGVSSLKTSDPVTPETLFAIGSITKQFMCTALLPLAEEGKLSLDVPVAKYDPSLTRATDITLLDLGQHVSGYHDYYPWTSSSGPCHNRRRQTRSSKIMPPGHWTLNPARAGHAAILAI